MCRDGGFGAGSRLALDPGVENAKVATEWNDLLAGARRCPKCGEHAAIPAVLAETAAEPRADASGVADNCVWFCFECGHEEKRLH
jgi:hypothetical protein